MKARTSLQKTVEIAAALMLAASLGACVETLPQPVAETKAQVQNSITPRPGVSPSGASIAFAGLAGAPDNVRKLLGDAMTAEVRARKLTLGRVEDGNYVIRGSASAFVTGKSTQIIYVWDIYGADKQFKHRLQDSVTVKKVVENGWSLVNEKVAGAIAARSVREISAYLTHTPEAIAGSKTTAVPVATAGGEGPIVQTSASLGAGTLSYSRLR